MVGVKCTDHLSSLLGGSRFSSSENAAPDGSFEPSSAFRIAATKDATRMHDKDAVRCLAVNVSAVFLPFARFFLLTNGSRERQYFGHKRCILSEC